MGHDRSPDSHSARGNSGAARSTVGGHDGTAGRADRRTCGRADGRTGRRSLSARRSRRAESYTVAIKCRDAARLLSLRDSHEAAGPPPVAASQSRALHRLCSAISERRGAAGHSRAIRRLKRSLMHVPTQDHMQGWETKNRPGRGRRASSARRCKRAEPQAVAIECRDAARLLSLPDGRETAAPPLVAPSQSLAPHRLCSQQFRSGAAPPGTPRALRRGSEGSENSPMHAPTEDLRGTCGKRDGAKGRGSTGASLCRRAEPRAVAIECRDAARLLSLREGGKSVVPRPGDRVELRPPLDLRDGLVELTPPLGVGRTLAEVRQRS